MGLHVKKKDPTGLLYTKGVKLELIDWVRDEAARKGYSSTGAYLNQLLGLARQASLDGEDYVEEAGDEVC